MAKESKVDYMSGGVFFIKRVASDLNLDQMNLNQFLDYEIITQKVENQDDFKRLLEISEEI